MEDRKHILLAEGDEAYAELISIALEQAGAKNSIDVEVTDEAAMAHLNQKQLEGERALPVLIVLASRMQGFYGFPLLRWIKSQPGLSRVPAFVFSGDLGNYEGKALELGATCYAEKPMRFEELVKLAKGVTNRWLR